MQTSSLLVISTLLAMGSSAGAASAGPRFYGDPPDDHHPWAVHDGNRPQPRIVTPGTFSSQDQAGKPPSDAIVLFDGSDLSKWESDGAPAKWAVRDGYMEVVPSTGTLRTKDTFGDCQLHIEWAAPAKVEGDSQGRGNSGIFLMGMLELQVLDSYNNITYADGHAGSVYGLNPPLVNALRPPGQWQVYDIVFRRPVYKDGQALDPGYVTLFVNGVLVQDHFPLEGPGGHMGRTKAGPFPAKGPLTLQDHGNPTRFRNIWYRQLPPRPVEGSTDGYLTREATSAKRQEIAASIRQDAQSLANANNPTPEMLRLMESLVYAPDDAALRRATELASAYVAGLKGLPADKLAARKDEAVDRWNNFNWLLKNKVLPSDFGPAKELDALVKSQGWDKKKK